VHGGKPTKHSREVHADYQASSQYLREHWEELLERHANRWVAIAKGKVFGVDDDVVALVDQLGHEGVADRAVVALMTREEPPRYLPPE
jgi:hypothetical protein